MSKIIAIVFLFGNIYLQESICGNSILNQTISEIDRNLECESNQFKIRKNVLQTNNLDYYFECVNFIFIDHLSSQNTHIYVEESEYINGNIYLLGNKINTNTTVINDINTKLKGKIIGLDTLYQRK